MLVIYVEWQHLHKPSPSKVLYIVQKKSFVLFGLPIYMEYVSMHYSSLFFEHFSLWGFRCWMTCLYSLCAEVLFTMFRAYDLCLDERAHIIMDRNESG